MDMKILQQLLQETDNEAMGQLQRKVIHQLYYYTEINDILQ